MGTTIILVLAGALGGLPAEAAASMPERGPGTGRLEVFAGGGYLASPGGNGAAVGAGVRVAVTRALGVSFDLGYGVLQATPGVQDRWWLMPTLELSVPAGWLRLDLGAGLGLAASSGYVNWPQYEAQPFDPIWAFQLVPAARGHVSASAPVSRGASVFARLEAGTLLLGGTTIGSRVGNLHPNEADTFTVLLWAGVRWRAF